MPGKGARVRRKAREEEKMLLWKEEERVYIESGGMKNCKTCYCYSRCPVYGDEIMPCWVYGGVNDQNK